MHTTDFYFGKEYIIIFGIIINSIIIIKSGLQAFKAATKTIFFFIWSSVWHGLDPGSN